MQEEKLAEPVAPIDTQRLMPPMTVAADAGLIAQAAALLRDAKRPLILAGRCRAPSRDGTRA